MALLNNDNSIRLHIDTDADNGGIDKARGGLKSLDDQGIISGRTADMLSGALKAVTIAAAATGAAAVAAAVKIGFEFNSSVEQAAVKLNAFTHSQSKTNEALSWAKTEAGKTQFGLVDLANTIATLTPVSNQTGKSIYELVKQAEVLAALNPAEGLSGAAFSIREAFSSDWVSLVERFNLPRNAINKLKDEGVPAMEIISRTLKSMGVDYGLVAAQGKTTAARFDNIKDQFSQMAGVLTQPIFEQVSLAMGKINDQIMENRPQIDAYATAIGVALRDGILAVTNAIQEWYKWMKPTFDYIGSNKEALGILGEGFKNAAIIIGVFIGLVATGLVGAFAAMIWWINQGRAAFDAIGNAIYNIGVTAQNAVNNVVGWFKSLPARIKEAMASVEDTITAPFKSAFNAVNGFVSGIGKSAGSIGSSITNFKLPGFASGTSYAPGGPAIVGERGPEIVNLPRGSQVIPAEKTASLMSRGLNITQNIYNQVDYDRGLFELAWKTMHV